MGVLFVCFAIGSFLDEISLSLASILQAPDLVQFTAEKIATQREEVTSQKSHSKHK
jgi:hypothetical protein